MKLVVRLAILVVALSMISSVAFAAPTDCTGDQVICYAVTITSPIGQTVNVTYKFCLNDDGTGNLCENMGPSCADYLKLFGGGPGWFNFAGDPPVGGNPNNPNWSIWVSNSASRGLSGIYLPIGEGNLLTGVETRSPSPAPRIIVTGMKVKCP
jgi:hypothetical protein